jgi:hypothetical protein
MNAAALDSDTSYRESRLMFTRRVADRRSVLAAGLLVVSLASGCSDDRFNDPEVVNYTGTPVTISYIHNQQTTPMDVTVDRETVALASFRYECSDGALVALDASGNEVARRDAPLCAGDTWVIGERPSASP